MKLKQWLALSENQRVDFVTRNGAAYFDQNSDHFAVYEAVVKKLRMEFAKNPNVTSVEKAPIRKMTYPVLIVVSKYDAADELPLSGTTYFGFKVHHRALGKEISRYLKTWALVFAKIVGWTDAQTKSWSKAWEGSLTGIRPVFYHRAPTYYAADAIINHLRARDIKGLARARLRNEIIADLDAALQMPSSEKENSLGWEMTKKRVHDRIKNEPTSQP